MSRFLLLAALAVCTTLGAARPGTAAPTEKDKKLLDDVSAKLLAVCEPAEGFEWPPEFRILDKAQINAYAGFITKDGKRYPVIQVTEEMMAKVVQGDAHRLAFLVGHELGHIVKGHVIFKAKRDKVPFLQATFGRDEEVEADLFGFQLMLKAGYSFEKGIKAITQMQDLKLDYSSFEGLGVGHPSWNDRASKADKDKAHLWKAMAAFQNGVLFLATEDYQTAEDCFERVTRVFPECYEAWANLGYAQLMRYCDEWSQDDIRLHGIGSVVVGGFYTRVESVKVRKKDSKLWFDAVGSLREANRLAKGKQTTILANLGLAYLLHPEGKRVGAAEEWFVLAVKAAESDKQLDPLVRATLLINRAINTLADKNPDKAMTQLDEGEKVVRSFADPAAKRLAPTFESALLYTRALILAGKGKDDKEKAINLLGLYLRTMSPRSLWWDVGYDRYAELCKDVGRALKEKAAFHKDQPEPIRLVTGLTIKDVKIDLGGDIKKLTTKLGKGQATTAVQGTSLQRIRYETEGFELLANDEVVLAIILVGPNAPTIPLKGKMLGTGKVGELKVGMTLKEVDELLGESHPEYEFTEAEVYYRFYREQGVAIRGVKGKVIELVVVQLPSKP